MTAEQLRQRAKEKEAAEENDGLCDPANLELFMAWYTLGGSQSPPSLIDMYNMPAALKKDVVYIYSIIGDERSIAKKARKKVKPKPKPAARKKR